MVKEKDVNTRCYKSFINLDIIIKSCKISIKMNNKKIEPLCFVESN